MYELTSNICCSASKNCLKLDHFVTISWSLWDNLWTIWLLLGDHLVSWWLLGDHFWIICWLLGDHFKIPGWSTTIYHNKNPYFQKDIATKLEKNHFFIVIRFYIYHFQGLIGSFCDHFMTTLGLWWSLLNHLLAAWRPIWDHFKIPGWLLGDLFVSTCWPF